MNTTEKVRNTVNKYGMIEKGDRVLVALSGGSDSVAMLHILNTLSEEMEFSLYAAHINHNIRAEAKSDEEFVRQLCKSFGIACFVKSVDVTGYARKRSISAELAGRKVRYDFFEELKKTEGFDKIATAHNKNDSAESVLLHLLRGCGVEGMGGIAPKRGGYIIRPVIDLTKKEIEEYCRENSLSYVTDKTNFTTDYTRNKIRLELLPMIEGEFNPNFIKTLTENAVIFSETADFLDSYSQKVYNRVCDGNKAWVSELMCEDIAVVRCVIQKMFCEFTGKTERLSLKYINGILDIINNGATSKTVNLPEGVSARIEYGRFYFKNTNTKKGEFCRDLIINERAYVSEANVSVIIRYEDKIGKSTKNKIYFYADENSKFTIRSRKNADIFSPVGMKGRKKISDLLSDLKIPADERNKVPVLVCDEKIVWVSGIRRSREFQKGQRLLSCEIERIRSKD